jgi:hypothetical protein
MIDKTNSQGFIKIHRQITEWEWFSDHNTFRLFIYLLLTANFEDRKWRGILIKRGQIVIGRTELAKSTHLTEQQVRTSLNKLKSTNEITIKTTNKFSVVELVNYNVYQDNSKQNNQQIVAIDNQQITNNQPTNNQQVTTTKELKEIKKSINTKVFIHKESPKGDNLENFEKNFEALWQKYIPPKNQNGQSVGRGSSKLAKVALKKVLKKFSFQSVIAAVEPYLADCQRNNRFSKQLSTWLNQECFNDVEAIKKTETKESNVDDDRERLVYQTILRVRKWVEDPNYETSYFSRYLQRNEKDEDISQIIDNYCEISKPPQNQEDARCALLKFKQDFLTDKKLFFSKLKKIITREGGGKIEENIGTKLITRESGKLLIDYKNNNELEKKIRREMVDRVEEFERFFNGKIKRIYNKAFLIYDNKDNELILQNSADIINKYNLNLMEIQ